MRLMAVLMKTELKKNNLYFQVKNKETNNEKNTN